MKLKTNRTGGFTIIEVVLVLAVAGLIFLVVFAAIPRLQASRRDNQIKRDMEALYTLSIEYLSNTGNLPHWGPAGTANSVADAFDASPSGTFWDQYASSANLTCPSGGNYTFAQTGSPGPCQFYYNNLNWRCNDTNDGWLTGGDGFLLYGLERGEGCISLER